MTRKSKKKSAESNGYSLFIAYYLISLRQFICLYTTECIL
jgi:hypothetical protein